MRIWRPPPCTTPRPARSIPPASGPRGWQVSPLVLVLLLFFGLPMVVVFVVSFFDFSRTEIVPAFILDNYIDLFRSDVTLRLYLSSLKFAAIVWLVTLVLGFNIAYFLVFHVRSLLVKIGLFLLCTVPFLTSNIIRMISWIPFLGRNGIFNQALMGAGITSQPLEFLLFSDFAVVVAYVHLFTLFMVVPIFNSMARIDPRACSRRRATPVPAASASSTRSCCRSARPGSRWARSSWSPW